MADSDKNILITPNRGATSQPSVVFTGQGNDPITVRVLDGTTGTGLTAGGALSFEGSAGQLFSVVNRLGTGSIFSVNDISGIPSIDVDASGRIHMAAFTGFVGIGLTAPSQKLHVSGNALVTGDIALNGGTLSTTSTTANVFNTTATTLNIGGASTLTTIAGAASGLTLNIADTTHFSGQKNINIATNVSGGGTQRIAIGQGGGSIVSTTGGLTLGSSSGEPEDSSVTNILGTSCNITPPTTFNGLLTASAGISASGGTFSGTVNMGTNLIRDIELQDYYETVATPSFTGGVLTCDLNSAQVFNHTLTASITKILLQNVPNKANTSVGFSLVLKQGASGGYTAAFSGISGATAMFSGGTPPTLTTTANKTDIVSYVSYDQGLNWFGFVGGQNY